jgi:hypothetical protein
MHKSSVVIKEFLFVIKLKHCKKWILAFKNEEGEVVTLKDLLEKFCCKFYCKFYKA